MDPVKEIAAFGISRLPDSLPTEHPLTQARIAVEAARGAVTDLAGYNEDCLDLLSRDALKRLRADDPSWQDMLPKEVVALFKERGLLGYR